MLSGSSSFSIPVSVAIRAPLDVIWDVETDFASYPSTYSGVIAVEPAGRSHSVAILDGNGTCRRVANPGGTAISSNGNANGDDFLGSKWNYTRISVKEGQRYSTKVTVTQYERTPERCSLTASTDTMLGAACSLKVIVEPMPSRADAGPSPPECYRVTHMVTMIPYKWFSPLRGILCCMCLLKSRARMAIECDMEDLALLCEERARERRRGGDSSSLPSKAREGEGGICPLCNRETSNNACEDKAREGEGEISVRSEEPLVRSQNEQQQIDGGRQQEAVMGDADVAGGGGGGGEPRK